MGEALAAWERFGGEITCIEDRVLFRAQEAAEVQFFALHARDGVRVTTGVPVQGVFQVVLSDWDGAARVGSCPIETWLAVSQYRWFPSFVRLDRWPPPFHAFVNLRQSGAGWKVHRWPKGEKKCDWGGEDASGVLRIEDGAVFSSYSGLSRSWVECARVNAPQRGIGLVTVPAPGDDVWFSKGTPSLTCADGLVWDGPADLVGVWLGVGNVGAPSGAVVEVGPDGTNSESCGPATRMAAGLVARLRPFEDRSHWMLWFRTSNEANAHLAAAYAREPTPEELALLTGCGVRPGEWSAPGALGWQCVAQAVSGPEELLVAWAPSPSSNDAGSPI